MKKLLPLSIIIASILILSLTGILPAKAFYPSELVQNGDFEQGNSGAWTGDTNAITSTAPVAWHSGTQGLAFQADCNTPSCWHTLTVNQNVTLPANASSLIFSGWFRHLNSHFSIRILNANNPAELWAERQFWIGDNYPDWSHLEADLTSHRGGVARIEISSTIQHSQYYAYMDDVSVIAEFPDITAPGTAASQTPTAPQGQNGWYTTAPLITLAATDDAGGSGVQAIYWRWDDAAYVPYTGAISATEGTHALWYYSEDAAGNVETAKSIVVKVDSIAPTATVNYSTTTQTTGNVVSTLVPSEAVTVTNNGGGSTRDFTANGNFTFAFTDAAGHTGTVTATVGNIIPPVVTPTVVTASPVVGGPVARIPVTPVPQVLGEQTSLPVITALATSKGVHKIVVAGKSITIRPFGQGYTGKLFARRVEFRPGSVVLVFANMSPTPKGGVRLYSTSGKLIRSTILPGGVYARNGLNADIVVQGNDTVQIALGAMANGTRAFIYQVTNKTLIAVKTMTVNSTPGNVLVKFLSMHKTNVNLVSALKGKPSTVKSWGFSAKRGFARDGSFRSSKVKVAGNSISLKVQ